MKKIVLLIACLCLGGFFLLIACSTALSGIKGYFIGGLVISSFLIAMAGYFFNSNFGVWWLPCCAFSAPAFVLTAGLWFGRSYPEAEFIYVFLLAIGVLFFFSSWMGGFLRKKIPIPNVPG